MLNRKLGEVLPRQVGGSMPLGAIPALLTMLQVGQINSAKLNVTQLTCLLVQTRLLPAERGRGRSFRQRHLLVRKLPCHLA